MNKPVTPLLTVDTIILMLNVPGQPIVLIERKNPPYGWALPGGFVDVGESLETAAIREAKEETCLDIRLRCLLGCYSDPDRDERGHTVSVVYIAESSGVAKAADDAKNIGLFSLDDLPQAIAFDHKTILDDYRQFRESGELPKLTRG